MGPSRVLTRDSCPCGLPVILTVDLEMMEIICGHIGVSKNGRALVIRTPTRRTADLQR